MPASPCSGPIRSSGMYIYMCISKVFEVFEGFSIMLGTYNDNKGPTLHGKSHVYSTHTEDLTLTEKIGDACLLRVACVGLRTYCSVLEFWGSRAWLERRIWGL